MKVHFVCSGNTNRSRMAEAYFNSKQIAGVSATSSGIHAAENHNGEISWYAKQILEEAGIFNYTAQSWTQTSLELLKKQDVVIFIQAEHNDFVQKKLHYSPAKFEVWDIPDIQGTLFFETSKSKARKLHDDKEIFEKIKEKVDILVKTLA